MLATLKETAAEVVHHALESLVMVAAGVLPVGPVTFDCRTVDGHSGPYRAFAAVAVWPAVEGLEIGLHLQLGSGRDLDECSRRR